MKDYYKILGIQRSASSDEIKRAYYKLIKIYHPDLHGNDETYKSNFEDILEAYHTLGDLDNRLKYNLLLNRKIKIPKYLNQIIKENKLNHKKSNEIK